MMRVGCADVIFIAACLLLRIKIHLHPPARNTFSYIGRISKENNIKEIDIQPSPRKFVANVSPEICDRILEYAPDDQDIQQALLDLLENRRVANRRPVKTMRAMDGILRDLDKLSGGNRAMKLLLLDKAIKCSYLTVYPLKSDEVPQSAPEGVAVVKSEGVRFV